MRRDANDACEHVFGNRESRVPIQQLEHPGAERVVPLRVSPERVDKDVDVEKVHPRSSMTSSSPAFESRSTPGRKPPLPETGSVNRRERVFAGLYRYMEAALAAQVRLDPILSPELAAGAYQD